MKIYQPVSIVAFALALASCNNANTSSNSNASSADVTGYEKSPNGLQYKIITRGSAPKAQTGQYVQLSTTLRTLNGDLVFSTNKSRDYAYSPVIAPRHKNDPVEVLTMLGSGDSASVIIPESEFFTGGVALPDKVKAGDNLRMDIKVGNVYSADEYKTNVVARQDSMRQAAQARADEMKYGAENRAMDEYIQSRGWKADKMPSGLRVVVDKKGTGNTNDGDQLSVNYTGQLLNGTVFDSNTDPKFNHVQPLPVTVGQGQVIKGWDEGLKHFGKGGKGKLIIPARLGYGEQGQGKIPPNSTLVFNVEVLDVKPGTSHSNQPIIINQ